MDVAGLLSLPVEVLHRIGSFLAVNDVLACSASCYYLRHAFNDNIIWKKYIQDKFSLDEQNTGTNLEPEFSLEETLTPLCENRVTFMKTINLKKNWKNGNFVKKSSETSYSYATGLFNMAKVGGQAIYKERYLFLGRFIDDNASDAIEVWDIRQEPVLFTELMMENHYYDKFYIVGDCLVVVECFLVNVYKIQIPIKEMPILFSFFITGSDIVTGESMNHSWNHDYRCDGWRYSMIDQYLFANKCDSDPNSCVFHVWDILNIQKVGTFFPPLLGFGLLYHSKMEGKWLIRMFKQSGSDNYYFLFDFERKLFSDHMLTTYENIVHSVVHKSYFINFELSDSTTDHNIRDTICTVYDFKTSKKLKVRRFEDGQTNSEVMSTKVFNGQITMLCADGLHVVDVPSLETLHIIQCVDVACIPYQFNIYESLFVFGTGRGRFQIWNVSQKEKIREDIKERYSSHLYLNDSCSKLVFVDFERIAVYHFL